MAGLWPAGWGPDAAPSVAAPGTPPAVAPLILTVALPPALQRQGDALRGVRSPAAAARTPAHLTLFRHLPGPQADSLVRTLKALCARPAPAFRLLPPARWNGLWVAPVDAPALDGLRAELAEAWHGLLAPGDHAPPRLHISLGPGPGTPAPLPPGPWAAHGLLLWRHAGRPGATSPGAPRHPVAERGALSFAAERGWLSFAAERGGLSFAAERGGPIWTPLVATAFRG